MKKYLILLLAVAAFSCKKTELPSDLRFRTVKFFRNDSLIGQTDFTYKEVTSLLESEITKFNIGHFYSRHNYNFLNDSIQIDEDMFNGTDTSTSIVTLYVTGTKHLVSKIKKV